MRPGINKLIIGVTGKKQKDEKLGNLFLPSYPLEAKPKITDSQRRKIYIGNQIKKK